MLIANRLVIGCLAGLFLLTGCGRNLQSDTFSSDTSLGKVVYGTVVSARPITIKDNDSAKDAKLGGLAGGAVGGLGASSVGSGLGNDLAIAGGVIVGAVIGAVVEDELSTSSGYEYVVKLDAPKEPELVSKRQVRRRVNTGDSVESEIKSAAISQETAAEAISVIQQDDEEITLGTRVMVVYRDDRARITPVTTN